MAQRPIFVPIWQPQPSEGKPDVAKSKWQTLHVPFPQPPLTTLRSSSARPCFNRCLSLHSSSRQRRGKIKVLVQIVCVCVCACLGVRVRVWVCVCVCVKGGERSNNGSFLLVSPHSQMLRNHEEKLEKEELSKLRNQENNTQQVPRDSSASRFKARPPAPNC